MAGMNAQREILGDCYHKDKRKIRVVLLSFEGKDFFRATKQSRGGRLYNLRARSSGRLP